MLFNNQLLLKYHPDFKQWLRENEAVFLRFDQEANKLRAAGRTHYSARTIAEFLRHETAVSQIGGELKLDNNVVPDMARLYMELTGPAALGFFSLRARGR